MKTSKLIFLLLGCYSLGNAQNKSYQKLNVGDQVPEIVFSNVLNHSSKTLKLSDFKGRLVLLDMWATTCSSCIRGFPKMQELQDKYSEKIQILLANPHHPESETEEKVSTLLKTKKMKTGFNMKLPVPLGDTILKQLFPHHTVPHYAWISPDGKLIAITGGNEVTETNIETVLRNGSADMETKEEEISYDGSKSIVAHLGLLNDAEYMFRSAFTRYKSGIGSMSGYRHDSLGKVVGLYRVNTRLFDLIRSCYPEFHTLSADQQIIDIKNPDRLSQYYCYDLITAPIPRDSIQVLNDYLRADLTRVFNIEVKHSKKEMKVWVIRSTEKSKKLTTRFRETEIELEPTYIKKYLHNYSFKDIFGILEYYSSQPLIDETNFNKKIDLDFPDHFRMENNTEAVMKLLRDKGFEVKEELRLMDVVILSNSVRES